MAVIVRRRIENSSGMAIEEKVYRSMRHPITQQQRVQAESLDEFIAAKMQEILDDLERRGLLEGRGDLERWHAVGEHLSFVDDEALVPPEDRNQDRYIWEALWAHAPEGVRPGPPNSRTGTPRDHFRECYHLARFPFDVAQRVGNWSDWVNFLESPAVMEDKRITTWVAERLPRAGRGALRSLARVLRRQFRNRDLSVLDDEELEAELEQAWAEPSVESP